RSVTSSAKAKEPFNKTFLIEHTAWCCGQCRPQDKLSGVTAPGQYSLPSGLGQRFARGCGVCGAGPRRDSRAPAFGDPPASGPLHKSTLRQASLGEEEIRKSGCASSQGWRVQREMSPAEARASSLVAWMAGRRETDDLKPIDKAIFGMVSELLGRNESERRG